MRNLTKTSVHHHKVIVGLVFFIALVLALSPTAAQSEVTIQQPVDGLFVRGTSVGLFEQEIGTVDTGEGIWSVIQVPLLMLNPRPLWSPNGQEIAFSFAGKYAGIVNILNQSVTFTTESVEDEIGPPFDISAVRGWSADGQSLVIESAQVGALSSLIRLYTVDLTTFIVQEIRQWYTDAQVTDMPLPPNATSVQLTGGMRIERNPVFDDWFIMQFAGRGYYSTFDVGEPVGADINVLWNFRTNEYISLDALVPDLMIETRFGDWSRDGTRLLLNAFSRDLRNEYILAFHFTPSQGLRLVGQAIVDNRTPQHWLDAGSLFFSHVRDYQSGSAYVLGEVVNGEYREMPFFTLNSEEMFGRESYSDWYMQADGAERHALSCLFEWSLPARFGIGDRAQVNFTTGTPLRLREAPDLDAAQITQMPEGTAFEVIGGPACVNTGDDHYRFWQIELDDSTVGWAAEAGVTDYFMEPAVSSLFPNAGPDTTYYDRISGFTESQ